MGCKWCSSGLGRNCEGPLGMDDIECGCDCDCHRCDDCNSTFCETMGGPDECDNGLRLSDEERGAEHDPQLDTPTIDFTHIIKFGYPRMYMELRRRLPSLAAQARAINRAGTAAQQRLEKYL